MRESRTTYLPMEAGESDTAYNVRLARSLLFNTFVKVREGLVGIALKPRHKPKPLASPTDEQADPEIDESNDGDIQLKGDVPLQLREHIEDIDLGGNHLDVFAKDLFRDVINDGHAFIFVDNQPALPKSVTSASSVPDASDDIAANRRPYWVKYRKDQAINWSHDRVNGKITLTRITFEECISKSDGEYGEKEVTRYRVLRLPLLAPATPGKSAIYGLMEWELYEKQIVGNKEELVLVDGNKTVLSRIPIVTIYARRIGFLESQPPLEDLAYLNVGHWQQWSDLNSQLRMLVPMLVIYGSPVGTTDEGGKKQQLKAGPGTVLQFRSKEEGGSEYVSHDGKAIEATRQSLIDLEDRMSAMGLSIVSAKPEKGTQAITATEKVIDQSERESELSSWLRALKDGIEAAFEIHAVDYLGLPTGGSIILGFDKVTAEDEESLKAIDAPKGILQPKAMPPSSTMVQ